MLDHLPNVGRIGRVDGAILLNWHDDALQAQIDYGAKEGHIKMSAAKTELRHFKRHVVPVAEFFDFKQLLYVVRLFSSAISCRQQPIPPMAMLHHP